VIATRPASGVLRACHAVWCGARGRRERYPADARGGQELLAEQCPHRRASLSLGCAEGEGLRCGCHGWLFDTTGRCLEQPAPLLPGYDLFVWDDVWRDIGHAVVPCNFLQIIENSVEPYHVEWLPFRYGSFPRELAGERELEVCARST
jgi:5,5'-dehydrodivanillate O-demethylase